MTRIQKIILLAVVVCVIAASSALFPLTHRAATLRVSPDGKWTVSEITPSVLDYKMGGAERRTIDLVLTDATTHESKTLNQEAGKALFAESHTMSQIFWHPDSRRFLYFLETSPPGYPRLLGFQVQSAPLSAQPIPIDSWAAEALAGHFRDKNGPDHAQAQLMLSKVRLFKNVNPDLYLCSHISAEAKEGQITGGVHGSGYPIRITGARGAAPTLPISLGFCWNERALFLSLQVDAHSFDALPAGSAPDRSSGIWLAIDTGGAGAAAGTHTVLAFTPDKEGMETSIGVAPDRLTRVTGESDIPRRSTRCTVFGVPDSGDVRYNISIPWSVLGLSSAPKGGDTLRYGLCLDMRKPGAQARLVLFADPLSPAAPSAQEMGSLVLLNEDP